MLLTLGNCRSRNDTAVGEYALRYPGRYLQDANVIRRLEQGLRETGNITSMVHINLRTIEATVNERCHIFCCGATAEENLW
jgi:hypothetical protein